MSDNERRDYELVYIIQPNLDEGGVGALNDRVVQAIAGQNGQLSGTELWGRRTLAYPIRKYFEGTYVLHRFQMAPSGADELDRLLRYNEDVIRYMLVRTDT